MLRERYKKKTERDGILATRDEQALQRFHSSYISVILLKSHPISVILLKSHPISLFDNAMHCEASNKNVANM